MEIYPVLLPDMQRGESSQQTKKTERRLILMFSLRSQARKALIFTQAGADLTAEICHFVTIRANNPRINA